VFLIAERNAPLALQTPHGVLSVDKLNILKTRFLARTPPATAGQFHLGQIPNSAAQPHASRLHTPTYVALTFTKTLSVHTRASTLQSLIVTNIWRKYRYLPNNARAFTRNRYNEGFAVSPRD
jgi:hypothetical protein